MRTAGRLAPSMARNLSTAGAKADHRNGEGLPCPSELIERAALIEEGDRLDREAAERRALTEHGFASWSALALAHADRITIELERLPPPCEATGARLLAGTLKLITGPHWLACVAAGWPVCDVFGVDPWAPHDRPEVLGLVPRVAFHPQPGRRLQRITDTGAEFTDRDGRGSTFYRPSLAGHASAVKWWNASAIVSDEAA